MLRAFPVFAPSVTRPVRPATAFRLSRTRSISPTSLSHLQVLAMKDGYRVFQKPQPTDFGKIADHCRSDSNAPMHVLGYTSAPTDYTAPDYQVHLAPPLSTAPWHYWKAKLELVRQANEGTLQAFYVAPGIYDTGQILKSQKIYLTVDTDASNKAAEAEMEHINDHWEAYTVTLLTAQSIISGLQTEFDLVTPEGGGSDRNDAIWQLTKQLNETFGMLGVDPSRWAQLYKSCSRMTKYRDDQGWHSLQASGVDSIAEGYVKHARFGKSEIGSHTSSSVVQLSKICTAKHIVDQSEFNVVKGRIV